MIDSNVALPRRSEIAADDYDPLPCRALEAQGAWSGRAGTKCLRFFANAFAYITEICG